MSSVKKKKPEHYICRRCKKCFENAKARSEHTKIEHAPKSRRIRTARCLEPECNDSFVAAKQLRNHLVVDHGMKHMNAYRCLTLNSQSEVDDWLAKIELENNVHYLKTNVTVFKDHSKVVYTCNRSGVFRSRSVGKRQLKHQGTAKSGSQCTSQIIMAVDDEFEITYYPEHYKHDFRLGYIPLPQSVKQEIANKLLQGVSYDEILKEYQTQLYGEEKRHNIITKKDIHNINQGILATQMQQGNEMSSNEATTDNDLDLTDSSSPETDHSSDLSMDKFSSLNKAHKGNITWRHRQAMRRHKEATGIIGECKRVCEDEWSFTSSSEVETVKKIHDCSIECCEILCRPCLCCLDSYTCSCLDYSRKNKLCKHIHAVNMFENNTVKYTGPLSISGKRFIRKKKQNKEAVGSDKPDSEQSSSEKNVNNDNSMPQDSSAWVCVESKCVTDLNCD